MKTLLFVSVLSFFVLASMSVIAQNIIKEFEAPGPEPRGLAWDGQNLWCADADEDAIFKIDPVSGEVLDALPFDVPSTYGGGITWSGDGAIWVTRGQYFHKMNTATGQEMADFHCPGG